MPLDLERREENPIEPQAGFARSLVERVSRLGSLSGNLAGSLGERIARRVERGPLWVPDVGSLSPRLGERFAGNIVEHYPAIAAKYEVGTMEAAEWQESDFALPPVSPAVWAGAPGDFAGEPATLPDFPNYPPPEEAPAVPLPKTEIRGAEPVERKPGVRSVSRVEELTAQTAKPAQAVQPIRRSPGTGAQGAVAHETVSPRHTTDRIETALDKPEPRQTVEPARGISPSPITPASAPLVDWPASAGEDTERQAMVSSEQEPRTSPALPPAAAAGEPLQRSVDAPSLQSRPTIPIRRRTSRIEEVAPAAETPVQPEKEPGSERPDQNNHPIIQNQPDVVRRSTSDWAGPEPAQLEPESTSSYYSNPAGEPGPVQTGPAPDLENSETTARAPSTDPGMTGQKLTDSQALRPPQAKTAQRQMDKAESKAQPLVSRTVKNPSEPVPSEESASISLAQPAALPLMSVDRPDLVAQSVPTGEKGGIARPFESHASQPEAARPAGDRDEPHCKGKEAHLYKTPAFAQDTPQSQPEHESERPPAANPAISKMQAEEHHANSTNATLSRQPVAPDQAQTPAQAPVITITPSVQAEKLPKTQPPDPVHLGESPLSEGHSTSSWDAHIPPQKLIGQERIAKELPAAGEPTFPGAISTPAVPASPSILHRMEASQQPAQQTVETATQAVVTRPNPSQEMSQPPVGQQAVPSIVPENAPQAAGEDAPSPSPADQSGHPARVQLTAEPEKKPITIDLSEASHPPLVYPGISSPQNASRETRQVEKDFGAPENISAASLEQPASLVPDAQVQLARPEELQRSATPAPVSIPSQDEGVPAEVPGHPNQPLAVQRTVVAAPGSVSPQDGAAPAEVFSQPARTQELQRAVVSEPGPVPPRDGAVPAEVPGQPDQPQAVQRTVAAEQGPVPPMERSVPAELPDQPVQAAMPQRQGEDEIASVQGQGKLMPPEASPRPAQALPLQHMADDAPPLEPDVSPAVRRQVPDETHRAETTLAAEPVSNRAASQAGDAGRGIQTDSRQSQPQPAVDAGNQRVFRLTQSAAAMIAPVERQPDLLNRHEEAESPTASAPRPVITANPAPAADRKESITGSEPTLVTGVDPTIDLGAALMARSASRAHLPITQSIPSIGRRLSARPESASEGEIDGGGLPMGALSKSPQIMSLRSPTVSLQAASMAAGQDLENSNGPEGETARLIARSFASPVRRAPAATELPLAAPSAYRPTIQATPVASSPSVSPASIAGSIQRAADLVSNSSTPFPLQRAENLPAALGQAENGAEPELDLDQLARQVLPIIKKMLAIERERMTGR